MRKALCTAVLLAATAIAAQATPARHPTPAREEGVSILRVNYSPGREYGPEVRKYQGIPSLERAPGGRLWAVWYAGREHEDRYNYVVAATSADDGATWSDIKFVIDPDGDGPLRASDPCPWLDPTGRLWLFWWVNGAGDTQLFAMTTDEPDLPEPSWTEPRVICPGVMMCKPLVTADGAWLLPTAIWGGDASCRVVASIDAGETWKLRGTAGIPEAADRNCDEPMMVQRTDGNLWMLVRTNYGIGETVSEDCGRTWTPVRPSGIPHTPSRFFIRRLISGNLLFVKHGPMDRKTGRSHLTAFVSRDDGEHWEGGLLVDERSVVSYPDGTQSPDGLIRIIYDWNRADDKHILMSVFTEDDVLAARDVSGRVRQRTLINRATGINPKPWLRDGRFLGMKSNVDGAVPLTPGAAVLEPVTGEPRTAVVGEKVFSDRPYVFHDQLPQALRDKRFVFSSIDASAVVCRRPGAVLVVTPLPRRNRDSAVPALTELGFVRAAVPEFVLFLNHAGHAASANVCSVFQKTLSAGENLEIGKWGIVFF